METVFLCWNLSRRPLQQFVAKLARTRDVDELILLECAIGVADLLLTLNKDADSASGIRFELLFALDH